MVNPQFWNKKKVLITGHTGFKGSWLTLYLKHLGAEIIGFSLPLSDSNTLFYALKQEEQIISTYGDIQKYSDINEVVEKHQPEIIFHLAAQSIVRTSYLQPVDTFQTNIMGTVHILEAARLSPTVKTILNITTDKCYENREWDWGYREIDRLGGADPYSASKACSELATAAYKSSFLSHQQEIKKGIATLRAGNVIGGGDFSTDRLIPDFIRAYIDKKPLLIRNPHSTRPWQHVLEPISAYIILAELLHTDPQSYSECWNIGPESKDIKPVKWIVDKITELMPNSPRWKLDDAFQPHETKTLRLDCSKIKCRTAWKPKLNLEESLANTINWYSAFLAGEDMLQFSLNQIIHFQETR